MEKEEKYEREHEHKSKRHSKLGDFMLHNNKTGLQLLYDNHKCGCVKRRKK